MKSFGYNGMHFKFDTLNIPKTKSQNKIPTHFKLILLKQLIRQVVCLSMTYITV